MGYTLQEQELYQAIKREAFDNGETLEQAEQTARDYLYYTRRDKFHEARKDRDDIDGYGHKI